MRYLIDSKQEKLSEKDTATVKTYLEFTCSLSDLLSMADEDQKIITMHFTRSEHTTFENHVLTWGAKDRQFSFAVPLKDPEDIYSLINLLDCGIKNALSDLFEEKCMIQYADPAGHANIP